MTFVASTGYYFTPKGGGSRQWVSNHAAKTAVVIDYVALAADQDAAEKERNREATPEETAAYFAAVEAAPRGGHSSPRSLGAVPVHALPVHSFHQASQAASICLIGSGPRPGAKPPSGFAFSPHRPTGFAPMQNFVKAIMAVWPEEGGSCG